MKAYFLSLPDRIKNFSDSIDAKAVLCNRVWEVFNDEGIKQVFIFNNDGTLIISTNGDVARSSWQYIPTNNSVIIDTCGKTEMFHPMFADNILFALKKDGVSEYVFMIDEKETRMFPNKKLEELQAYLINKLNESKRIEEEYQQQTEEKIRKQELAAQRKEELSELVIQTFVKNKEDIDRLIRQRSRHSILVILGCIPILLCATTYAILVATYVIEEQILLDVPAFLVGIGSLIIICIYIQKLYETSGQVLWDFLSEPLEKKGYKLNKISTQSLLDMYKYSTQK